MKKIVSIIGTRPQFIKVAVVYREIEKKYEHILIHTGQHYNKNMSKVFFDELQIPKPEYNIEVGSGTHGYQTGEMLKKVEKVLLKERPCIVLVYGDTNSTLAGALSAAKLHIPVAHIEAGLRSFDKSMPEEINRVLTDHASDLLFCPTQTAVENLIKEGIDSGIYKVGDVMLDALKHNKEIAETKSTILYDLNLESKRYLVATIHRQNNTDNKKNLQNIVDAFCGVDEKIVFPVHPRTVKYLKEYDLYDWLQKFVKLIKPVGYLDFLKLMVHSKKILTDSGGIQKEAYMLKIPCITLRDNTEWIETVEDGWNVLAGTDTEKIMDLVKRFNPHSKQKPFFGDGKASEKIKSIIDTYLLK